MAHDIGLGDVDQPDDRLGPGAAVSGEGEVIHDHDPPPPGGPPKPPPPPPTPPPPPPPGPPIPPPSPPPPPRRWPPPPPPPRGPPNPPLFIRSMKVSISWLDAPLSSRIFRFSSGLALRNFSLAAASSLL